VSVPFYHCSILIFILIFLLSEGQAGEDWEPSKSSDLSKVGEQWIGKHFDTVKASEAETHGSYILHGRSVTFGGT
jgi:hypothetical protein